MPYVDRGPGTPQHRCPLPGRDSAEPDRPRRHDVWRCPAPTCGRLYYCSGWSNVLMIVGRGSPDWHRVPAHPWLSARWIRRLWATMVSPPVSTA